MQTTFKLEKQPTLKSLNEAIQMLGYEPSARGYSHQYFSFACSVKNTEQIAYGSPVCEISWSSNTNSLHIITRTENNALLENELKATDDVVNFLLGADK